MRWNTPLSDDHAQLLLDLLDVASGTRVLDLGCGWGELLLRAVAGGTARTTGTGVDTDSRALARGRALAADRGLADRVKFHEGNASVWGEVTDRVLCVGASHMWKGAGDALQKLACMVAPGGRLLFGDGCWERPPTPAAEELFAEVSPLDVIVEQAVNAGWRVLHVSTADQREWDEFEASWRANGQRWLVEHPDGEHAADVRARLDRELREYLSVYRGVLGFCYFVLAR